MAYGNGFQNYCPQFGCATIYTRTACIQILKRLNGCPNCFTELGRVDGFDRCVSCGFSKCDKCGDDHYGFSCETFHRLSQSGDYKKIAEEDGTDVVDCPACGYKMDNIDSTMVVKCLRCSEPFCWQCSLPIPPGTDLREHSKLHPDVVYHIYPPVPRVLRDSFDELAEEFEFSDEYDENNVPYNDDYDYYNDSSDDPDDQDDPVRKVK